MRRAQGLTLLEVVVGAALLGLIVSLIWGLMVGSANGYARDSARQMMVDNARRILDEMAQELRDADSGSMTSPADGKSDTKVLFKKSIGFDTSTNQPIWSNDITYNYELGKIWVAHLKAYDYRLVRDGPTAAKGSTYAAWKGPNVKVGLTEYVKPGGFTVARAGDRVTITLTLRTFDEELKELTTTLSTTITLRNSSL